MEKRGLFIVFEGIDGSGKSTQIGKLADYIREVDKYQDVLLTREPTWRSKELKKLLIQEKDAFSSGERMAQLFIEDRKAHTFDQISSNLNQGVFVLCDRYSMSTCAYQSAQGVNLTRLIDAHRNDSIIIPDLTFFINVPEKIAEARM